MSPQQRTRRPVERRQPWWRASSTSRHPVLAQAAGDEVAGGVAELGGDEAVESFGVGFDAPGFFAVFPGVVVVGVGGGDDADAVGAGGFGDVGDGVFEVVGLLGG